MNMINYYLLKGQSEFLHVKQKQLPCLSKFIRLGSKELCIPLFSLPGERVCERAYFPDTSDIPTIQLAVVLCDFLSFSLMSTSVIYF